VNRARTQWEMDSSIYLILIVILYTNYTADVANSLGTRPPSISVSVHCTENVPLLLNAGQYGVRTSALDCISSRSA
jgi:hypothetical protein